jgi:exosortase/archaeosortase family protein
VADSTISLNARIGRTMPCPPPKSDPAGAGSDPKPSALTLLLVLMFALWPHWSWMARRLTDGSDEPWGVLALITAVTLVAREWRTLSVPSPAVLGATAALAIGAAVSRLWLPPLAAAAIAMTALAAFLAGARRDRPTTALASLLLLALPVIATLQFYFGYPLRLATATLAAPVLRTLGFAVEATGAALAYRGQLVLIDPPCAGIGMLWVGAFTASLLSYVVNASTRRTILNGAVAAGSVFIANVVRNVALFFPEALSLRWPEWMHAFIGLIAFSLALLPIVLFAQSPTRHSRKGCPEWPPRYHRRIA